MDDLLSKVKANLILEHTVDDALIESYITAAVSYAESYQHIDDYHGIPEGVLGVKRNGKWGYVDESGNVIVDFLYDPYKISDWDSNPTDYIYTAVNGHIAVTQNGKWGLLDKQGNIVVDVAYDGISQVNPEGMFWLQENGTWSLYKLGE